MRKVLKAGMLVAVTATVATTLFGSNPAEAYRHGVNNRQTRQQQRIFNGVAPGQLTNHEARSLENKEARLNNQERRMRRSGNGLSGSERARLEREQNHLSRDINNQKHDGQAR